MNTTVRPLKLHYLFCLSLIYNLSSVLVFRGFIKSESKFWLAVLLSGVLFIGFIGLLLFLIKGKEEMSVFSLAEYSLGKKGGKIAGGLFAVYSLFIAVRVLNSASSLIVNVSLDKTPQILIITIIGFISVYALSSGLDVLGKFGVISFCLIALFIITALIIGSNNIEWKYAFSKSVFSLSDFIDDTTSYFAYPFAENIILLCLIDKTETPKRSRKVLMISMIVSTVLITLISLFCLAILGLPMLKTQYYTFYSTVSVINFGMIISRIEIIVSIILVLSLIIKFSICIYFCVSYINSITVKGKNKYYYICITVFTAICAALLGSRNYYLIKLFESYKIWAGAFQIVLPLVITIPLLRKKKALTE